VRRGGRHSGARHHRAATPLGRRTADDRGQRLIDRRRIRFSQEWPAFGQRDQLSYTIPLQSTEEGRGLGDVALNYRRQVLGHDEEPVWFSPRLSVVLPTGSVDRGTGAGGMGVQLNLPVSVRVGRAWFTHWNAGGSVGRARTQRGGRGTIRSLTAAASAIYLLAPELNLMLESVEHPFH
jgi:hypothetical protein